MAEELGAATPLSALLAAQPNLQTQPLNTFTPSSAENQNPGSAKKRGRPRALNPDGTFKFPKRPPTVKRPRITPDGLPVEKRPIGRPRKLNPDGSYAYPIKSIKRDSSEPDVAPKPRSDWLGDPFTRKEIFKALHEYDFAWLPTVHSLQQKFPEKFDKLGESTIRSWFEPGTRILRPQVLKKLEKSTGHSGDVDIDDETARIIVEGFAEEASTREAEGAGPPDELTQRANPFHELGAELIAGLAPVGPENSEELGVPEGLGEPLDVQPPASSPAREKQRLNLTKRQLAKRHLQSSSRDGAAKRLRSDVGAVQSSVAKPAPVTFADLGGIDSVLKDIQELVQWPIMHPEIYAWLGVEPPRGVLLHGPPGCGKTALANAIANECSVPFLRISAPEIVSGMSGESEMKVRQLFQEAAQLAPCIVFIDEIDAIAGKRESAQREMERRIVAQMLTCMDDLSTATSQTSSSAASSEQTSRNHVLVIGATNRPDSLDTALRRAGRFDREISLGIPNQAARARILKVIAQKLRLSGDFDLEKIAARTPGFVGADLQALTKEAAALAVSRIFSGMQQNVEAPEWAFGVAQIRKEPLSEEELAGLAITMGDFEAAVSCVQPSVRREGFATTPDVTWNDVGALREVREELDFAITQPIRHPERFQAMGLIAPSGVLLYGPPGCGKTLLAKAVANESGANFISIKGPELLNKYVGESERAVRQVFARARAASPCVLFFDEMDALAPRRGSDSNQSSERVVNQLLTEMDGIDGRKEVYIIAATNRPDIIDKALLRPGRLDKMLYIPLPTEDERTLILLTLVRGKPLNDVNIEEVARQSKGFSGADLGALVKEAATNALKENMLRATEGLAEPPSPRIEMRHFQTAMQRITPSVSLKDQRVYDALRSELRTSRINVEQPASCADPKRST